MLKFFRMRKILAVVLQYLFVIITATILLLALLLANSLENGSFESFPALLGQALLPLLPLAALIACTVIYFRLNRLYKNRLYGYLTLFLLDIVFLGLPLFFLKSAEASVLLFPSDWHYLPMAGWYTGLARLKLMDRVLPLLAFSVFSVSTWGISRISGKRPIWGAFLIPSALIGQIFLLEIFSSELVVDIFALIGVKTGFYLTVAICCAVVAATLIGFDFLIASRPGKGNAYG